MGTLILLHGSRQIVTRPQLSKGKEHNDYGRGFYCTEDEELAGEWACRDDTDGFVNRYRLDTEGLKMLDLCDGEHTDLNWIAMLLEHRSFRLSSPLAEAARSYLIEHFSVDVSAYDLVRGYRADDSYFQYAQAFVENMLPLQGLNSALRLGKLGIQTVLVSERAFSGIHFLDSIPADRRVYYQRFIKRDRTARRRYADEIAPGSSFRDGIFVMDILREEMKGDDLRLQRTVSE